MSIQGLFQDKNLYFTMIAYIINEKYNTDRNNLVLSGHILNV